MLSGSFHMCTWQVRNWNFPLYFFSFLTLEPQIISKFMLALTFTSSSPCWIFHYGSSLQGGNGWFWQHHHIPSWSLLEWKKLASREMAKMLAKEQRKQRRNGRWLNNWFLGWPKFDYKRTINILMFCSGYTRDTLLKIHKEFQQGKYTMSSHKP